MIARACILTGITTSRGINDRKGQNIIRNDYIAG